MQKARASGAGFFFMKMNDESIIVHYMRTIW